MQRCRFCDHQNLDSDERCKSCGAPLPGGAATGAAGSRSDLPPEPASGVEAQVLSLMRDGRKIEAIGLYRQQQRVGLKEAKDAVEALAAQHGIQAQGKGCTAVLLIVATAALLLKWGA